MKNYILLMLVVVSLLGSCFNNSKSQDTLNNEKIIELHRSGYSDEIILEFIEQKNFVEDYSISEKEISFLKQNGISDRIIIQLMKVEKEQKNNRIYMTLFGISFIISVLILMWIWINKWFYS